MRSRVLAFTVAMQAAALLAACGNDSGRDHQPAATQGAEIAFRTEPDPPAVGRTAMEVIVRDAGGTPVTDAGVTVELYMAAMPEIRMPEMRDTATLQHESGGVYRGTGNVMMAGDWDVTVRATRNGEEIGRRTFTVTVPQ